MSNIIEHDPPTVTVHVPVWMAEQILTGSGWQKGDAGEWRRPNGRPREEGGKFGSDFLWERDEALLTALDTVALGMISEVPE
jgi:hypothetical protein